MICDRRKKSKKNKYTNRVVSKIVHSGTVKRVHFIHFPKYYIKFISNHTFYIRLTVINHLFPENTIPTTPGQNEGEKDLDNIMR